MPILAQSPRPPKPSPSRSAQKSRRTLTCREIAARVGQRLLLLEDGVRLHLVAGARHQIAHLILERAVRHRNRAIRGQRIGQPEQL